MDRLSDILNRFSMGAGVFFTGNLCGMSTFELDKEEPVHGHLHLLRAGKLKVICSGLAPIVLDEPSVIYFPRGNTHRLETDPELGADLVCATIHYQTVASNPVVKALPELVHYPLSKHPSLGRSAEWLFEEAFDDKCGRQPMINRLCDIFIIQILREVLTHNSVSQGMLSGLSHPQLSRVLTKIHESPEAVWTLDDMASEAGMSRSKFAAIFKELLGQTPGDYIADWRMSIAQTLLKKDKSVGIVAHTLGYENGSAFARVFRKRVGMSPKEWLKSLAS